MQCCQRVAPASRRFVAGAVLSLAGLAIARIGRPKIFLTWQRKAAAIATVGTVAVIARQAGYRFGSVVDLAALDNSALAQLDLDRVTEAQWGEIGEWDTERLEALVAGRAAGDIFNVYRAFGSKVRCAEFMSPQQMAALLDGYLDPFDGAIIASEHALAILPYLRTRQGFDELGHDLVRHEDLQTHLAPVWMGFSQEERNQWLTSACGYYSQPFAGRRRPELMGNILQALDSLYQDEGQFKAEVGRHMIYPDDVEDAGAHLLTFYNDSSGGRFVLTDRAFDTFAQLAGWDPETTPRPDGFGAKHLDALEKLDSAKAFVQKWR